MAGFNFSVLRRRLLAVFAVMLMGAAVSTALSVRHLRTLQEAESNTSELAHPYSNYVAQGALAAKAAATEEGEFLLTGEEEHVDEIRSYWDPAVFEFPGLAVAVYPPGFPGKLPNRPDR